MSNVHIQSAVGSWMQAGGARCCLYTHVCRSVVSWSQKCLDFCVCYSQSSMHPDRGGISSQGPLLFFFFGVDACMWCLVFINQLIELPGHSKSARFDIVGDYNTYCTAAPGTEWDRIWPVSLGSLGTCRKCNQISQRRVRTHRLRNVVVI